MSKMAAYIVSSLIVLSSATWSASAYADSNIENNPTAWRLQDYQDGAINVFFAGSSCANDRIFIPASTTNDIKNRFWSTVLSAKMANKVVGLFYNATTCEITSFYLKEG